ncbi:MAG: proline--tRNA ligase [Planctomycetota bacterium]
MTTSTEQPATSISNRRRGDVSYWSKTLIPTTRDAPSDAEMPSHILLTRAGFIRRVGAGIYDYLPLGYRSIQKIEAIVREEMNAAGASELLLPALAPIELLKKSNRDEAYGDQLFRLTDRHGRVAALGPTHEEVITELAKAGITSYKQMPVTLYQIQTKFRDEFRPRSALLRGREFIMKDAYSFALTVEGDGGLNEQYDAMYQAYVNIFTRLGLDFSVVEAEAGPIGGSASHEFMVNCDSGEDTILKCDASGYAANVEKCEIGERAHDLSGAPTGELERVHTPKMPGIDLVADHLGVDASQMLKTIVMAPAEPGDDKPDYVLAVVRGDHEVNEGKVRDAVGFGVELADEKAAKAAGFKIGYVSPKAAGLCKAVLIVDPDAAQGGTAWATGADEYDHHVKHFNWSRDMADHLAKSKIADIRNAMAGDPSPRDPNSTLRAQRGIEVGHIFKLGTKYAECFDFVVLDENQKKQTVIMGCYGIGVSRTLASCVEMSHDDNGIVFPPAIAPYHVEIVLMDIKKDDHRALADKLAQELADAGADVLIDDRKERPGVKFKDADLIGVPVRITIGDKALAERSVEFKRRGDEGKGEWTPIDNAVTACLDALA